MPGDSTYIYHDSTGVSITGSLQGKVNDIYRMEQNLSEGWEGIQLPSLPQTENWIFAVLLGLFVLLVIAVRLYPSFIKEDIRSIFHTKERSSIFSNPEGSDSRLRVLYIIFAFCTISLYAYVGKFETQNGNFSIHNFLHFLIATTSFFLIKSVFIRLLNYVFFDKKTMKICIKNYYNLIVFLGLALFPLLILTIYSPGIISQIAQKAGIIICIVTAVVLILRLFQIFFSKLLDSFYILLYLCTLEILPVLALFQVYEMIV